MEQQQNDDTNATTSHPSSFPTEVILRTIDFLLAESPCSALDYASVNRQWQSIIYQDLFHTLRVNSTSVSDLRRLSHGQLQYVREIIFHHSLPTYGCDKCDSAMTRGEIRTYSHSFRLAFLELISMIEAWNSDGSISISLSLDLFCPSDYDHWKLHLHTNIASPMTATRVKDLNLEFFKFRTYADRGHRWQHAIKGRNIPLDGVPRPFTTTTRPSREVYRRSLQVQAQMSVQELHIKRQVLRQIDPITMVLILQRIPMLERLHYEKWRFGTKERELFQRKVLHHALRMPKLRYLTIYEDSSALLDEALYTMSSRAHATPQATAAKGLFKHCGLIEELSLSNVVDGGLFFRDLEDPCVEWPFLRQLILTMDDFTSEPSHRRLISEHIMRVANVLPKVPNLRTLRLYNGDPWDACLFSYSCSSSLDEVMWQSGWDFRFTNEEKLAWTNATLSINRRHPVFVEDWVDEDLLAGPSEVLDTFGLVPSVIGYQSYLLKGLEETLPDYTLTSRIPDANH